MKTKIIILFLLISSLAFGQFKKDTEKPVSVLGGITNNAPSSFLLGFINPQNFHMNHTFSMSYSAFGNNGVALGVYTNNMSYQISDDLSVQADISFVNSPYSSLGEEHAKSLNGIYLSRAQVNYQPSDNFRILLEYNQIPGGFYSPFRYRGYSPFYYGRDYSDFR